MNEKLSNKIEIFVNGEKVGEVERLKITEEDFKVDKIKTLNGRVRYSFSKEQ